MPYDFRDTRNQFPRQGGMQRPGFNFLQGRAPGLPPRQPQPYPNQFSQPGGPNGQYPGGMQPPNSQPGMPPYMRQPNEPGGASSWAPGIGPQPVQGGQFNQPGQSGMQPGVLPGNIGAPIQPGMPGYFSGRGDMPGGAPGYGSYSPEPFGQVRDDPYGFNKPQPIDQVNPGRNPSPWGGG
jgi:hypothetical protein